MSDREQAVRHWNRAFDDIERFVLRDHDARKAVIDAIERAVLAAIEEEREACLAFALEPIEPILGAGSRHRDWREIAAAIRGRG